MLKRWTREFAHMAWFFDPQLQFIDSFRCAVKEIEVATCGLWAIVFDGKKLNAQRNSIRFEESARDGDTSYRARI